jgi:hypothetical protein
VFELLERVNCGILGEVSWRIGAPGEEDWMVMNFVGVEWLR